MSEQDLLDLIHDLNAESATRAAALVMLFPPSQLLGNLQVEAEKRGLREEYRQLQAHLRGVVEKVDSYWQIRESARENCLLALQNRIRQTCSLWIIHGGQSQQWLQTRAYLEHAMGLKCCEFNDPLAARVTIQDRVKTMAETCRLAVAVMTGEDTVSAGQLRARQNVVHEIGLSQGVLGFDRVVIMIERGVEEPSNLKGLVYVYFERDNIAASFADLNSHITSRLFTEKGHRS